MATITATGAQSYAPIREVADGVSVVRAQATGSLLAGATASAGDVYLLTRIPNYSIITDVKLFGRTDATSSLVEFGITGVNASMLGKMTVSTVDTFVSPVAFGLPYKVSLSDDATQYVTVQATVPATGTATMTFGVVITYGRPGTV